MEPIHSDSQELSNGPVTSAWWLYVTQLPLRSPERIHKCSSCVYGQVQEPTLFTAQDSVPPFSTVTIVLLVFNSVGALKCF